MIATLQLLLIIISLLYPRRTYQIIISHYTATHPNIRYCIIAPLCVRPIRFQSRSAASSRDQLEGREREKTATDLAYRICWRKRAARDTAEMSAFRASCEVSVTAYCSPRLTPRNRNVQLLISWRFSCQDAASENLKTSWPAPRKSSGISGSYRIVVVVNGGGDERRYRCA